MAIINMPMFQRMHNIRQLSLGYYVYHGAEHSRFGHMVGAMHLAGLAYDSIEQNSKEYGGLDASEDDRKALRLAGLLHDTGHPPFSHSLESLLHDKHESYSKALVLGYFAGAIEKAGVDPGHVNSLIQGMYSPTPSLGRIINGEMDVDRMDYLLRDSHYAGVMYGTFDLSRIMDQLCVVDGQPVVLEGGYGAVEQMIFARYQMYQQVYFHKTKRAFELMLSKCGEILTNADMLKIPSPDELYTEKGQLSFLQCDDRWFLNKIFGANNSPFVKTMADMIKNRRPYLETYSPSLIRGAPALHDRTHGNAADALISIQYMLQDRLKDLGMSDHEFLFDSASRSPYALSASGSKGRPEKIGTNGITIFYKNNRYLELIEQRSDIVRAMAAKPAIVRGFVHPSKYRAVREFLQGIDFPIPDREAS